MMQFDKVESFGKDSADAIARSLTAISNGAQSATAETTGFVKKSFEDGSKAAERLLGARSLPAAIEIQGEYVRSSYESFVAQATRMGELAANTAKEAFAPVESLVGRPFQAA